MEQEGQAPEQPSVEDRLAAFLAEPEEGDAEVAAEAEQETPEEEVQEQPEEGSITIDPDAPLFEVSVRVEGGGTEVKNVSLAEMQKGYMMQADYQRKTAELARAKDQLSQEVSQMVEPERQMYQQNLQVLQQMVQGVVMPELQNINWEQLASENPAEYVRATAKAQKAQQMLSQIQQQSQQLQQRQFQETAKRSVQILSDPVQGIAGWNNEMYQGIISEGSKEYGFATEEVANVVDHRMIKVLHDALQYRKLKSAKPTVEKKVVVAPKVLKPGAPAGEDQSAKETKALRAQFHKTGNMKDAARYFEKYL